MYSIGVNLFLEQCSFMNDPAQFHLEKLSVRLWMTCVLLLFSQLAATSARSQSQVGQQPYRLTRSTQAVVLDVVVTDRKGNVVTNLTKDDFVVYEDKVPQTIRTFDRSTSSSRTLNPPIDSTAELDRIEPDAPVTIIVLDEINTQFQDEAFARYALQQFLEKQGDVLDHPTLLGAVDLNHFTLLHDYTTSKQELLAALAKHKTYYHEYLEGSSWHAQQFIASFEGLLEVTQATAGHLGHKSLLWIGRGFPPFDTTTLSEEDNEGMRQILESCTNAMRDTRVVLYTLDPAGVTTEAGTVNGDSGFIDDPFDGELDFSKIALATGGHAFFGRNDIDELIAASSSEGASFYTLSYKPTVPITDLRAFRGIRVVMKNPDLSAETRTGYYAHPPSSPPKVGSKHADRPAFDLGLAARSLIPYDAVHMTVTRLAEDPNKFRITLHTADLAWTQGEPGKILNKVTVVAEAFDRNGTVADRTVKISTLQDGESSTPGVPLDTNVNLAASVSTKLPASRIRIVIRDEVTGKIGALDYPLDSRAGVTVSN
jgi:VWFA-related protein